MGKLKSLARPRQGHYNTCTTVMELFIASPGVFRCLSISALFQAEARADVSAVAKEFFPSLDSHFL